MQNRTSAGANISTYAYGFDAAGTPQRDVRTWMESQVGANPLQHVNYGYDAVDQLTSEVSTEQPAPQLSNSYVYDPMGNRTQGQQGGTQGSYTSNKLNQLFSLTSSTTFNGVTTSSTSSYSYDHGGNLSSTSSSANASGTRYVYDDLDRLSQIIQLDSTGANAHKSEHVYDGLSRKVISREYSWDATNNVWSAPTETRRVYDGMDVVQERDAQNNVTVNYTTEGGIGGLLARTVKGSGGSPDQHFFYHYDGSGNVTQLSDASQATVATYSYDAYGNTLSSWGPQSAQPYRYSAKEWDSTNGLYDYGFRFYSPSLGRWINRDPIAEDGGLNLYGFVANNPSNRVDTDGLVRVSIVFKPFLGSNILHSYVVVTETCGKNKGRQYFFRGGMTPRGIRPLADNYSGPYGNIHTIYGPYGPGSVDWQPQPPYPSMVIVDDNRPALPFINRFKKVADAIEWEHIPYRPFRRNSNATARAIIERGLGINIGEPAISDSGAMVPGWDVPLPSFSPLNPYAQNR